MLLIVASSFICSFVISNLLSRYLLNNASRFHKGKRAYAERIRLHKKGVPRLGGLAIYGASYITILFFWLFKKSYIQHKEIGLMAIFLGSTLMMITGLRDDLFKRLSYKIKFLLQILSIMIIIMFGYHIDIASNPFGGYIYIGGLGIILTFCWIMGITNAINLIDGLDGLACGISILAFFSFLIVGWHQGNTLLLLVTSAVIGSSLAFLRYNFYPATLFLGDSGSYFLGFMLAILAIESYTKRSIAISLTIPLVILFVPVASTLFTFTRRITVGNNPFKADRMHIHYRLLRAGVSHLDTVLIYYSVTFAYVALGILCFFMPPIYEYPIILFAAVMMLGIYVWGIHFLNQRKLQKRKRLKARKAR